MIVRALLLACALVTPALADGPLERLAIRVPVGAEGMVVLTDVAASLAETAPLSRTFPGIDKRLMAFAPLTLIGGFDISSVYPRLAKEGLRPMLGIALDQIGQIASWQAGLDKPVILAGLGAHREAVATVLHRRGFSRTDRAGMDVWSTGEDLTPDAARSEGGPFVQVPGHAARIALDGDHLLFARSWAGLDTVLAGGPGLDSNRDIAAILRAGYAMNGRGRFLETILLGPQITREAAVRAFIGTGPGADAKVAAILAHPGYRVNPFPPFQRHAILLWQDGRRISGALALPYADRGTAVEATMAFGPLGMGRTSLFANAPFGQLFPYVRWTSIVETGDRAVALIGFEETRTGEPTPMMFVINPYDRLRDMLMTGDLALLVAR